MYYAALLLFKATVEDGGPPLYEESVFVVDAATPAEARRAAEQIGQAGQHTYKNVDGKTVSRSLDRVVDVAPIPGDRLGHGSEIYSRHFSNFEDYKRFESLIGKRPPKAP